MQFRLETNETHCQPWGKLSLFHWMMSVTKSQSRKSLIKISKDNRRWKKSSAITSSLLIANFQYILLTSPLNRELSVSRAKKDLKRLYSSHCLQFPEFWKKFLSRRIWTPVHNTVRASHKMLQETKQKEKKKTKKTFQMKWNKSINLSINQSMHEWIIKHQFLALASSRKGSLLRFQVESEF